jgi:hypothetical protein
MMRVALVAIIVLFSANAGAVVVFQNTGNLKGWDRLFTQHNGTNTEVSSPAYKGATAVENKQIFEGTGNGRYHSEIEAYRVATTGDDHYFGQAFYIPKEWEFHNQNVAFQQWAPDDNSGPWLIMNLNGDHIHWLGGIGTPDLGAVTDLRGTWIRVVTRIKMATNGILEVWINGKKTSSINGNFTVSGGSIRWSAGIYCTRWINQQPTGPKTLALYHDHFRVATTYEEADPANWDDGDAPPPDGGATADAGVDARTADAASDSGGAPDAGPIAGAGGAPGTGGAGGAPAEPPPAGGGGRPPARVPTGGCAMGGRAAPGAGVPLLLALLRCRQPSSRRAAARWKVGSR